ncbi:MAG: hypothetical protein MUE88_03135 [Flavobacteriales bacterium]|jgi:hypothetical protein|nr:hypothetical protein [Flavobacteriales bacterium]
MHPALRYILTKAADLGAMSGVVRRMFGYKPVLFRNMRAMSGDLIPETRDSISMSGNMAGMVDNTGMMSADISAMPCDLPVMPGDIEALSDNYAGMSLGSLLRSLNPLRSLRDMVVKLRFELNEWYWRRMGLADPVQRKIFQEADFDELFVLEHIEVDVSADRAFYVKYLLLQRPVHPLLEFLVVSKKVKRDALRRLAVLRMVARKVMGLTDQQRCWAMPWQYALTDDSGRRPLSPRPPPFALH